LFHKAEEDIKQPFDRKLKKKTRNFYEKRTNKTGYKLILCEKTIAN